MTLLENNKWSVKLALDWLFYLAGSPQRTNKIPVMTGQITTREFISLLFSILVPIDISNIKPICMNSQTTGGFQMLDFVCWTIGQ